MARVRGLKGFQIQVQEIHKLWCLASQEVNFKPRWQYTNQTQLILVSLKVFMSPYSLHACQFAQPEAKP